MRALLRIVLSLCLFICCDANAYSSPKMEESHEIAAVLHRIRYYDAGCTLGDMPDVAYSYLEDLSLNAIPTLLREIVTEDIYSKVGPNGYIYVSLCIIRRIADKIRPLDWDKIYKPLVESKSALFTLETRYQVQEAVIKQLEANDILECHAVSKKIVCAE